MQGQRVRRALWRETGGETGLWLEVAEPALPDGRKLAPLLICPLPDGTAGVFTGGSWDLLAGDWEIAD
jgi:hypothetical protein